MKTFSKLCICFNLICALLLPGVLLAQASDTTLQGFSPFYFGAAINVNLLKTNASYRALVSREYSSVTPENAMKFGTLHPAQNTYSFKDGDTLVNFAQLSGKRVHGHTLIWHNSLPSWVTNFAGDSAAWENLMQKHIDTVVKHFKGQLRSWDVVNEAFEDDGTLRNSVWLQHLGPNFIARAFQYAHAADTAALLFYNDYGHEYSTAKLAAIKSLATGLLAAGIPIHGIGLQLHINKNTSNVNITRALDSMLATGLKIHLAELDVAVNPEGNLSLTYDSVLASQLFGKYKFICRYARKIDPEKLYGITTWNVTDGDSWIPANYNRPDFPLPFNSSYKKKSAFQAIRDALTKTWNYDAAFGESFAGTYTDLGTSGTLVTTGFTGNAMGSDNDNSSIQDIGFDFTFNGSVYRQFVLNTNGYIKMGSSAPSANNIFYPTASGNTGGVITASDIDLIYPFNHDLKSGTSTAQYRVAVTGPAGSRVCTIQFKNIADKIAPVQYTNIEFQVKLYEGTNNIEFIYGNWQATANASTLMTAAIGIKGINAAESVNLAKGSTVPWNTPLSVANNYFFKNDDYVAAGPLFNNRNGFMPDMGRTFRFSGSGILPVTMLGFTALEKDGNSYLQWTTTNEVNLRDFGIERSLDGANFINIGTVNASNGTVAALNRYNFTDFTAAGNENLYYRLRQVDLNGRAVYSPVVRVNRRNPVSFNMTAANPVTGRLQLQVVSAKNIQADLQFSGMDGKLIFRKRLDLPPGSTVLGLDLPYLAAGLYLVQVRAGSWRKTIELVKQ